MFVYDDTSNASNKIDYLRLTSELKNIVDSLETLPDAADGLLGCVDKIMNGNKLILEIEQLSSGSGSSLTVISDPALPLHNPRKKTDHFYQFVDSKRKQGNLNQRQKANDVAYDIVEQYLDGKISIDSITDDQKVLLGKYSGNGGGLVDKRTNMQGSAYEYYTPKPIAESVWGVLGDLGYSGGKVLDPCAGVGVFGATAPLNTAVDAVELDKTSGTINKLINQSDSYNVNVTNFEKIAANTPDESYDAIVANVPFGDSSSRGSNYKDDPKLQKASLEYYFIMRTLDKLKGGGLAAFIVPDRCVTGRSSKESNLRLDSSLKGEFLGAFRLPNSVFKEANADVVTCVMFYRKYTSDALAKIDELYGVESSTLNDANVIWGDFVDGRYFETAEGKKHVLGDEYVEADSSNMHSRAQLKSSDTVPDTAQKMLLSKLPKTRVNWGLLAASIGDPIIYNDGDTITQNGVTLKLIDGKWVAQASKPDYQLDLLSSIHSPYNAVINGATLEQVDDLANYMKSMSLSLDMPSWMVSVRVGLAGKSDDKRKIMFKPILIGLAVKQVLNQEGLGSGVNFKEMYLFLSGEMEKNSGSLSRLTGLTGNAKDAVNYYNMNYKRGSGFSDLWLGLSDSSADNKIIADSSFEGLIYKNQSTWVGFGDAKAIFGDDFDPFESDDFCLNDSGTKVCKADDYYVGSYDDFLKSIDFAIENAPNELIKNKLVKQKMNAGTRITKVDAKSMQFDLFSPYVTIEEKAEFLRRNLHSSAKVVEKDGKKVIDFHVTDKERINDRKLNFASRIAEYMKSGNISLQNIGVSGDSSVTDAQKLQELRDLANGLNDSFNSYVRQNKRITSRLESVANDPKNIRFIGVEDEAPLTIQGMNEDLTLHGYQNAFVRKVARDFSGINGFGVGLGKTFTSLASVQYIQSIGVKKRTMFVVPNSVLSNWRKEAKRAYQTISDCMFVGLREVDGAIISNSKYYDEDLMSIPFKKPSKIFISFEAFERIKLKAETIEHFENYISATDSSFSFSGNKKNNEKTSNKLSGLTDVLSSKKGSAPYLEDLGVDSIVIDEAHAFKNSSALRDFEGGKYLSISPMSARGLDAQAKAWFIRGMSDRGDGVLLLTATPITNSPLEVYSVMSLAVGHDRVNSLAMGVKGADDFMNAVCVMEDEEEETIDGRLTNQRVFVGLSNPSMLRNLIGSVATIKTASDVGEQITVPDEELSPIEVVLDDASQAKLNVYKMAYQYAMDVVKEKPLMSGDPREKAYDFVKEKFGESDEVVAHPFNLINKMTTLIADPDLDEQYTKYLILEEQSDLVEKVVSLWNKSMPTERKGKLTPYTDENDYITTKKLNKKTGKDVITYVISVRCWRSGSSILLNSTDWKTQEAFEMLAEKHGLALDCGMSPKLAALFENLKRENSNVRGIGSDGKKAHYSKQIIFCDTLGLHNKIKRLITKFLGIGSGQIAIVTGQRNNDPSDILEIQNNFNGYGDDNYRIIIANEKAEVGINLQVGTQAIHHLTIGWTPDSLTQRNGRGVRQGNKTEKVAVYYYDAQGTFDASKRTLVNNKADWIETLLSEQGSNKAVKIVGGMSVEQMRLLLESGSGDKGVFEKLKIELEREQKLKDQEANRVRQIGFLGMVSKQQKFINENKTQEGWVLGEFYKLWGFKKSINAANNAIKKNEEDGKLHLVEKNKLTLGRLNADFDRILTRLSNSVVIEDITKYPIEIIDSKEYFMERYNLKKLDSWYVSSMLSTDRYKKITFNNESQLMGEHQFEIESAQGLIDDSLFQFKERSELDGAIDSKIIDSFVGDRPTGKFTADGQPYTEDCFAILTKHGLDTIVQCLEHRSYKLSGGSVQYVREFHDYSVLNTGKLKIIYPYSSTYDEICMRLAEYEDLLTETSKGGDAMDVFSSKAPLVANYRKKTKLTSFSSGYGVLVDGMYHGFVNPDKKNKSSYLELLASKQKQVIARYGEGGYFFVEAGQEKLAGHVSGDLLQRMEVFCSSNNVSASVFDIFGNVERSDDLIRRWIGTYKYNLISSAIDSASSAKELTKTVVDLIRKILFFIGEVQDSIVYDEARVIALLSQTNSRAYNTKLELLHSMESQI